MEKDKTTNLKISKGYVKWEPELQELGDVSEALLVLLQRFTVHKLRTFQMKIVVERFEQAADINVDMLVL